jgi:hypothetical protein
MSWDNDSDSSWDFLYVGSGGTGNLSWGGVIFFLILIGLFVAIGMWMSKHREEQDKKVLTYINAHQCKIDSFMGGDQKKRAVYQCAEGQLLDFQLREKALQ